MCRLTFLMDSNYTCLFTEPDIFLVWKIRKLGGKICCIFCRKHFYYRHKGSYGEQVNKITVRSRTSFHWHGGQISLYSVYITVAVLDCFFSLLFLAQLFWNLNTEALKKGIWNQGIVIILSLWCLVRAQSCGSKDFEGIPSKAKFTYNYSKVFWEIVAICNREPWEAKDAVLSEILGSNRWLSPVVLGSEYVCLGV